MKKQFIISMLAALFWACSEDNDGGDGAIKVIEGSTEQLVYANETQNKGFTFETEGAWYATVSELSRANEVDWVTLSQTSGDAAGEYTIYITLGLNHTGVDRKAQIKIVCGETNITILVEQKGTTESGAVVKLLGKVTYEEDVPYGSDEWTEMNFKYDQQGRVAQIETKQGEDDALTYRLDYTIVDEITITELAEDNSVNDRTIVSLNKNGTVASIATVGLDEESPVRYVYNADGLLSEINGSDDGYNWGNEWQAFVYDKNCIVGSSYRSDLDSATTDVFPFEELYPSAYPNNVMNLDPNAFFFFDDMTELLYALRLLGNTGKDCLIENMLEGEEENAAMGRNAIYHEPNVTLQESYSETEYLEADEKIYYTFDADNYIETAYYKQPYVVKTTTYTVTVSDELKIPDVPEAGYKYTTSNHQTSEVRHEGLHKYTFTYK